MPTRVIKYAGYMEAEVIRIARRLGAEKITLLWRPWDDQSMTAEIEGSRVPDGPNPTVIVVSGGNISDDGSASETYSLRDASAWCTESSLTSADSASA